MSVFSSSPSDVDECSIPNSPCHVYAECTDTPGAYECKCRSGFIGDGLFCEGKKQNSSEA